MREYQEDFITLYPHLRRPENKIHKQEKISYILQRFSSDSKQDICLDVGCSDGKIALSLSEHFKQVIGCDIDFGALKLIGKNPCDNVSFLSGDAMALPFKNEVVDTLVCSQIYEHVPSSQQLFLEMDRVLKDDGLVLFTGPNKTFPIEPHYLLPFLHWLNPKSADRYLQLTRTGNHYYERLETYWKLRKDFQGYEIIDVIKYVFEYYGQHSPKTINRRLNRVASKLPPFLLRIIAPFMININWILKKRTPASHDERRIKFAS